MKHCFVMNPAAGNGKMQEALLPRIQAAAKETGADYVIHRTVNAGEASSFVRRACAECPRGQTVRFYAVGGDGTLNEVLNGMYGFARAELACVPTGSGNDFIRNFTGKGKGAKKPFLDIAAQLAGQARPVDVMAYEIEGLPEEEGGGTRYALNMFNMGFDANVVAHTQHLKKTVFLKGTAAYAAGVAFELAAYRRSRASITIGRSAPFDARILLAGVGNGRFSGGGFDGIPMARVDDRLLDIYVINPITRREFLRLVGKYYGGVHINSPLLQGRLLLRTAKRVTFAPESPMTLSIDGEPRTLSTPVHISLAPKTVLFSLPG
ncbi:MAG: hypothetical protein LBR44_01085 [Clostridiales Family XIII bacterium]|jgi:diacylglycerol kinase family enzyme|nr:hypothetical protein [Clostridiales Family XIII bacterium]